MTNTPTIPRTLPNPDGSVEGQVRPEVRLNEDGTLDEIVANGAYVHLEQMDDGCWWMAVESGGHLIHVNLFTKRGAKILANVNDPA